MTMAPHEETEPDELLAKLDDACLNHGVQAVALALVDVLREYDAQCGDARLAEVADGIEGLVLDDHFRDAPHHVKGVDDGE